MPMSFRRDVQAAPHVSSRPPISDLMSLRLGRRRYRRSHGGLRTRPAEANTGFLRSVTRAVANGGDNGRRRRMHGIGIRLRIA